MWGGGGGGGGGGHKFQKERDWPQPMRSYLDHSILLIHAQMRTCQAQLFFPLFFSFIFFSFFVVFVPPSCS